MNINKNKIFEFTNYDESVDNKLYIKNRSGEFVEALQQNKDSTKGYEEAEDIKAFADKIKGNKKLFDEFVKKAVKAEMLHGTLGTEEEIETRIREVLFNDSMKDLENKNGIERDKSSYRTIVHKRILSNSYDDQLLDSIVELLMIVKLNKFFEF